MFKFLHKKNARPIFEALGTDIHCHLVPCVDDGSTSIEETMLCLSTLSEVGFSKVVITPHFQYPRYNNKEDLILQQFEKLKRYVADHADPSLNIELVNVAGEYRIDAIIQQRIEENRFLHIADDYLLTELSLRQETLGLEQTFFDLQMKGHNVILAHPERYPYYNPVSSQLERFKEMGVSFQVNILSLLGFYGESCRSKGYELIERGWVEFLGTDLHNEIYARALRDASHDRRIEKLLATHTFQNSQIASGGIKYSKL